MESIPRGRISQDLPDSARASAVLEIPSPEAEITFALSLNDQ